MANFLKAYLPLEGEAFLLTARNVRVPGVFKKDCKRAALDVVMDKAVNWRSDTIVFVLMVELKKSTLLTKTSMARNKKRTVSKKEKMESKL